MPHPPFRVPRRAIAIAAMGALALTAACGGSSSKSGTSPTATGDKGVKGGTLYLLSESDFEHLDPARNYVTNSSDFSRLLYRTLMTYDNKPGLAGTAVVPDLATAPGVPSENATVWTYHIKKGLKYEDGSTITTADIKYGVERTFSSLLPEGPPYFNQLLVGAASYKGPYVDKSPGGLASIETPDATTIIFHFAKPFADANYAAALSTTSPVPQSKDTGIAYDKHVFSSGPYKIKSYVLGKSIDLVRNTYWDPKSDPAIGAYPNEIIGTFGLDGPTIDQRMLSSTGNDAYSVTDKQVEPANTEKVLTSAQYKSQLIQGYDNSVSYSAMDTVKGPFKDIKVRQALEYGYPLYAARLAAGGPSVGDFATDVIPPTLKSHQTFDIYGTGPDHKGNPAKSKAMLLAAGYKLPLKITTDVANTPAAIATASAVKAALLPAGFDLEVTPIDPSKYYDIIGQPSKEPNLVGYGWIPDWPSASTIIPPLFTCASIKPQGNNNPANFCDPAFDKIVAQASAETDQTKQNALWGELDKMLIQQAIVIPRYYGKVLSIAGSKVKNISPALPFGGEVDLANVSVM